MIAPTEMGVSTYVAMWFPPGVNDAKNPASGETNTSMGTDTRLARVDASVYLKPVASETQPPGTQSPACPQQNRAAPVPFIDWATHLTALMGCLSGVSTIGQQECGITYE